MGKAKLAGLDREPDLHADDLPSVISQLIAKLPG